MDSSGVGKLLLVAALGGSSAVAQPRPPAGSRPRPAAAPTPPRPDRAPATPPPAPAPAAGPVASDPCEEALHAVEFEDAEAAERHWSACRSRLGEAAALDASAVRRLEEVASALHTLRRTDGAYCVAPAAPLDLTAYTNGAIDALTCLRAMDTLLASEDTIVRVLVEDSYASGRLAARAGVDLRSARRRRSRWWHEDGARPAVAREGVGLARMIGRQFLRVCRCLPGPMPESERDILAASLPPRVQAVLLEGARARSAP